MSMTEQERIVAWAQSVVDGSPMKRPTDLRIARAICGLAALSAPKEDRCPTCGSGDRDFAQGPECLFDGYYDARWHDSDAAPEGA